MLMKKWIPTISSGIKGFLIGKVYRVHIGRGLNNMILGVFSNI